MNEYLCRSYVAEQILGDMTEPASAALTADPAPRRRLSSTLVVGEARPAGKPQQRDQDDQDDQDELDDQDVQDDQEHNGRYAGVSLVNKTNEKQMDF